MPPSHRAGTVSALSGRCAVERLFGGVPPLLEARALTGLVEGQAEDAFVAVAHLALRVVARRPPADDAAASTRAHHLVPELDVGLGLHGLGPCLADHHAPAQLAAERPPLVD